MMAEDMRHLKQLATSRISSFKGYLTQKPRIRPGESTAGGNAVARQSWTRWAGDKLKGRTQERIECISLFPGWAARVFRKPFSESQAHFDVEVFVSGFASRPRSPNSLSRSQRAFLRLAKGFASLPKLTGNPKNALTDHGGMPLSKSTEELLASVHLPPPPSEMSEADEIQALEDKLRQLNELDDRAPASENIQIPRSPSTSSLSSSSSSLSLPSPSGAPESTMIANLRELHANLEARLQPFWSSSLPNRIVRLSLYTSEEAASIATALSTNSEECQDARLQPVMTHEVVTAQDGSFQMKFEVPWNTLCVHPTGVRVAFGDVGTEHDFFVLAQLLPPPPLPDSPTSRRRSPILPRFSIKSTPVFGTSTRVPLTFAPVRVISDIDDTVKMANISGGARAIFYTVFVRRLSDIVIPGMGEWYTDMWKRGVRFHYVSNGPFEILPVVNEFFQLAQLPPGSIRLRSYGGRSLFNGLLSAPAARKRQGVVHILDNFQESQFILVGDSGEQDLELYASLAAERPRQVLAVFIRDVRASIEGEDPKALDDPTGSRVASRKSSGEPSPPLRGPRALKMKRAASEKVEKARVWQSLSRSFSGSIRARENDYPNSQSQPSSQNDEWINGQIVEEPQPQPEPVYTPGGKLRKVSESEWKRFELQLRIDKARMEIPDHIPLRVFRNPEECVEATPILEKALGPGRRLDSAPDMT